MTGRSGRGMELDHLVIACENLDEGADHVASVLGVRPGPGGKHPFMGTHNMLLSLGPRAYLEVIAIDPDAPQPGQARWFALDEFSGPPRLTNWVARCGDLEAQVAVAPELNGEMRELARGDFRWRMVVLPDGHLPFDGYYPGLIQWLGPHPAAHLPEAGLCLERLEIAHPDAALLSPFLAGVDGVGVVARPDAGLSAQITTANGTTRLT